MSFLSDRQGKALVGVIHLQPLPGAPRWRGDWEAVLRRAVTDAQACQAGGADAVCLENFGDLPFPKARVGPETVACMAVAARAVRAAINLPLGFNVLRNDAHAALALCAACQGSFIRVNVLTGAMLTDQGIIEGNAAEVLRYRRALCPEAKILADVLVKHAVPLAPWPIERAALDTLERACADALIVTGPGTGLAADVQQVKRVRAVCPQAQLLVGSGVTVENAPAFLPLADGFIVGSSLKVDGQVDNPVDPKRVAALKKVLEA
jgi:hypothetical protein